MSYLGTILHPQVIPAIPRARRKKKNADASDGQADIGTMPAHLTTYRRFNPTWQIRLGCTGLRRVGAIIRIEVGTYFKTRSAREVVLVDAVL